MGARDNATPIKHDTDTPLRSVPLQLVLNEKKHGESFISACNRIAYKFGITGKYLEQIAKHPDKYKASHNLLRRIKNYHAPKKRHRFTVEVYTEEDAETIREMPMEERRRRMLG